MSAARHVPALDGLRGFAAAIVVVHHAFTAFAMPLALRQTILESPLALLLNGRGYIQIFFVLSGYVLASSLSRNRHRVDVAQFYIKRIFRIHPPFVFGALLAWAASAGYPDLPLGRPGLSAWISHYAAIRIDLAEFLPGLLFPGTVEGLLPVGWTLRVEMIYSILLPPMALFGRAAFGLPLIAVSLALIYFVRIGDLTWYSLAFSLGIVAYQQRERFGAGLRRIGGVMGVAAFALSSVVFCGPMLLGWWHPDSGILLLTGGGVASSVMIVGAAGLVVCAVHLPWLRASLSTPPMRFLGRISYSLYLVHFTVLILWTPVIGDYGADSDFPIFLFLVFATSIPLSVLSHRFVEIPSIRLGNFLCRGLARRMRSAQLESELLDS